jgi:hypothetical protein
MSETITLRSARTGKYFRATFPTADAAYDYIVARDHALIVSTEAVDEIAYALAEADTVYCSLCDGIGHGQPGHGPCPLENRGWMDTAADEDRHRAF